MSTENPRGGIDVDRLMDDLKRRVAARRAAGELDPRVLDLPFTVDDPDGETVRLRPATAYSSKPGIGRLITTVKRAQIRLIFHFLDDLVGQINGALARINRRAERAEREQERLERRLAHLEERLNAIGPPAERERSPSE